MSRMKCIICMSVQLNILCLICINRQYPKIALNLTMTHEFCSIFIRNTVKQGRSLTHVVSPDTIQHNHPQSFWQLINRLVQCVLTWLSPGVDQNFSFSWSVSEIVWLYRLTPSATTLSTLNNPRNLDLDCSAASFLVQWTQAHWNRKATVCMVNGVHGAPSCWNTKSLFEIRRIAGSKPCSSTFSTSHRNKHCLF